MAKNMGRHGLRAVVKRRKSILVAVGIPLAVICYGGGVGVRLGALRNGAGGSQILSDLGYFKFNFFGDNPGDSADIDEGIRDYGKAQDKKRD